MSHRPVYNVDEMQGAVSAVLGMVAPEPGQPP
jgi:hypothetical protein